MWGKLNHCRAPLAASCTKPIELQRQRHRFKPSCRLPGCPARCGPSPRGRQIECCWCLWHRWSGSRLFFSRLDWGWQTCPRWNLLLPRHPAGDLAERQRGQQQHMKVTVVFSVGTERLKNIRQASAVIWNGCSASKWDGYFGKRKLKQLPLTNEKVSSKAIRHTLDQFNTCWYRFTCSGTTGSL